MASRKLAVVTRSSSQASSTVLRTKLIALYGKAGHVERAAKVFEEMPQKNQVSWNAMLSVLVDAGHIGPALKLFDDMPQKNATSFTLMITCLSRSGSVSKARKLFDSLLPHEKNVFAWTAMMSCYVQNSEPRDALKLFLELYGDLFASRVLPSSHTFTTLLKASSCIRSLTTAMQMHALIVKLLNIEGKDCVFVQNALVNMHAKLGHLVDAERIFQRMSWKDLDSWNTMMDGYTHHMLVDKAFELFKSMKHKDTLSWNIMISGLRYGHREEEALRLFLSLLESNGNTKPNSSTYTIVLAICSAATLLDFGRQIHGCIAKNGFYGTNTYVGNSLLSMYAGCGLNDELERVFDEMPTKDVVSWNSAIQGLGQNGRGQRALEIAKRALNLNHYNGNTFIAILTSCSHGGFVKEALNYFKSMSKTFSIKPSLDHYICMIDVLGRAGKLKEAYGVLQSMPFTANSVAWNALLNACLVHKNIDIGSIAARKLQAQDPGDIRGYLALESIYRGIGEIKESRKVFDVIKEKGLRKEPGHSWVILKKRGLPTI